MRPPILPTECPCTIIRIAIHRPNAKYEITPGASQNVEKPARSQPYVMNGWDCPELTSPATKSVSSLSKRWGKLTRKCPAPITTEFH
jgi:hypothetical protein